ncbi:hypothetical protein [Orenia marismortui]|uniref:DUF2634 domain-containing protein n=1 Tax=Orenia marismortui TaxID=46469 RepID=A0A4R8GR59_9FIRM|nr:hypothetical protein [Orenia marismortui]TDX48331.1 hypothetical protein C7959_13058 [Orenia marismortui]
MKSLLLNSSGDLELDQFKSLEMVEGPAEIKQQIRLTLLTNRGEWFLNLNFGTPWLDLFRREISEEEFKQETVTMLNDIVGVDQVEKFDISLDTQTRKAKVTLVILIESGEEIILEEVV